MGTRNLEDSELRLSRPSRGHVLEEESSGGELDTACRGGETAIDYQKLFRRRLGGILASEAPSTTYNELSETLDYQDRPAGIESGYKPEAPIRQSLREKMIEMTDPEELAEAFAIARWMPTKLIATEVGALAFGIFLKNHPKFKLPLEGDIIQLVNALAKTRVFESVMKILCQRDVRVCNLVQRERKKMAPFPRGARLLLDLFYDGRIECFPLEAIPTLCRDQKGTELLRNRLLSQGSQTPEAFWKAIFDQYEFWKNYSRAQDLRVLLRHYYPRIKDPNPSATIKAMGAMRILG